MLGASLDNGEDYSALFVICGCRIHERVSSASSKHVTLVIQMTFFYTFLQLVLLSDWLPVVNWRHVIFSSLDFCLFSHTSDTTNCKKFKPYFFALKNL